jgi:two-component system, chemotaxis family, response regulator Rcp1
MCAAHNWFLEILLVEDSPSDAELTLEALKDAKVRSRVSTVEDGVRALEFLRRQGQYASAPRPDLILLDLKLPRKDGREVLEALAMDADLSAIPVAVLTISQATRDLLHAYRLNVSFYVTKPVDRGQVAKLLQTVSEANRRMGAHPLPD